MLPRVEEITKELDKQPQHSGHSAAAFIRSAKHRLTAVVPAASPAAHSAPFGSPAVSPSATALGDFVAEGFNPELTSQKEKSPQKQENFNVWGNKIRRGRRGKLKITEEDEVKEEGEASYEELLAGIQEIEKQLAGLICSLRK